RQSTYPSREPVQTNRTICVLLPEKLPFGCRPTKDARIADPQHRKRTFIHVDGKSYLGGVS
ncbi:hypothetical protein, partial [Sphingomonas sp. CFBP 8760]|uniref:hypothetical protein n=1 Tax=Sphingomonas sp. CFBP 8760 TaxID=2775282 RepID=UPI001A9243A9